MHGKFRGSISKFNGILWSVPGSIGIGYANEIIIIINLKDFFLLMLVILLLVHE